VAPPVFKTNKDDPRFQISLALVAKFSPSQEIALLFIVEFGSP
jgi:hypothetical protein